MEKYAWKATVKEGCLEEYKRRHDALPEDMKQQLKKEGLLAGLTALVQCSWIYAFIGQKLTEKYSDKINLSPYRSWFESYTSKEYINANQGWIDVLDSVAERLSQEETEKLCNIFITCARYENRLWDMFYNTQLL